VPAAERAHVDWNLALDRWVDKGAASHGRSVPNRSIAPLAAVDALAQAAPQWHTLLGREFSDHKMHQNESLDIKVVTQDGNEIFFRCRFCTPLKRLMTAFCNRNGVSMNSVRFLFDGNRLIGTQTPWDLKMLLSDCIDVMVEQRGN
jgi:hypothetical protein